MACTSMAAAAAVLLVLAAAVISCHARPGCVPQYQHGGGGGGGGGGCELSDIKISLKETRNVVEGQPEYEVTVDNRCSCPQSDVKLRCLRLPSVKRLDGSKIVAVDDDLCLVAGGRPIVRGSPVTFRYAWKTPQSFTVNSTKPQC
ncbi:hypothetical protein ACP4OV_009066 [Aristida adscensionis]